MIVVPAFAKGDQAAKANVMSLHGGIINVPAAMAFVVSEIADQPMNLQCICHQKSFSIEFW